MMGSYTMYSSLTSDLLVYQSNHIIDDSRMKERRRHIQVFTQLLKSQVQGQLRDWAVYAEISSLLEARKRSQLGGPVLLGFRGGEKNTQVFWMTL